MTPSEAEDLAARTLAAIDASPYQDYTQHAADRERVAADLAGLRACWNATLAAYNGATFGHAVRYADGLRRTAALYGQTP